MYFFNQTAGRIESIQAGELLTVRCSSSAEGHSGPQTHGGRPPGADGRLPLSYCSGGSSSPPGKTSHTCDRCLASLYHTSTFDSASGLHTETCKFKNEH